MVPCASQRRKEKYRRRLPFGEAAFLCEMQGGRPPKSILANEEKQVR